MRALINTHGRRIALVLAVVVVLGTLPGTAAAVPVLGDSDQQRNTYTVQGVAQPSVIVHYENDSVSNLKAWVNESDSRRLVTTHETYDMAVVAAPAYATESLGVTGRASAALNGGGLDALTASPLSDESWTVSVRPNYQITLDEPTPLKEGQFSPPNARPLGIANPEHPLEGMAFSDDTNATNVSVARDAIGADNVSATGDGMTVAIIDTGANVANGRLYGNGTANSTVRIDNASKNVITNTSVDTSADNYSAIEDGNGHGSWVASATLGNYSGTAYDGVAPDATGLILRALNDDGKGATADIAYAIRYAADHDADVIGMSLGSPVYSAELADAIAYAEDNGVKAVVVAAGNRRPQRGANIASPADADGALAVGSTTAAEPNATNSSYYSQVGPDPGTLDNSQGTTADAEVDVAAPGQDIRVKVADTGGSVSSSTLSGTSMAQPLVSGGIAAVLATNSTLADQSAPEIDSEVRDSARPAENLAAVEAGHGVFAADNLADGTHPATSQEDAMDSAAQQRDVYYRTASESEGGIITRALGALPV